MFGSSTYEWGNAPAFGNTITEWAKFDPQNDLLNAGVIKGRGIGCLSASSSVIYLDNVIVWEFTDVYANSTNIPATVTFANSTGYTGTVTMPNPVSGKAWMNQYNAQGTSSTLNLNNYTPTGAPAGKEFAGWSLSDGGNKIKDTMYSSFYIPSSITLYAVWQDKNLEIITKKEDFERFQPNQILNVNDLDFLFIQPFVATSTATVKVDENGNKYLRIEGPIYTGFKVRQRPSDPGTEYLKFNYRFTSATGSRFTIYSGTDHTGSNQIGRLTRTTDWTNNIIAFDTTKVTVGGFFDESATNCVIELDDVYYWYIPDGKTKTVTTTFANSTVNAPANPTLPSNQTKNIWTSPATVNNSIFLPDNPATDSTGQYRFLGWSRTDNGKVINSFEENYAAVFDETLYAVWEGLTYQKSGNSLTVTGNLDLSSVTKAPTMYIACYTVYPNNVEELVGFKKFSANKGQRNLISQTLSVSKTPTIVRAFVWDDNYYALMKHREVPQKQ